MANRTYNRHQSLEKEIKSIYADLAIGATGAVTLTKGLGIASVTRDSAGVYIITLDDTYTRLMSFNCVALDDATQGLKFDLEAEDVDGEKTIQFRCLVDVVTFDDPNYVTTPTETDPSSGARLLINIDLKNTGVGE